MAKMSHRELNAQKYKKFAGNKSEGIVLLFDFLFTVHTILYSCQPSVSVDSNAVDSVDSFVYVGSLLSSDGYYKPTHRPGLISHVCSALHLEAPISVH